MNKQKFINIHIAIFEEHYDIAIGFLSQFSILGIEECIDKLIISFNFNEFTDETRIKIANLIKEIQKDAYIIKKELIEERNWNEEWESSLEPVRIGQHILITPTFKPNNIISKYKILINPKMAFGTGTHPTTKMMCLLLETIANKDSFWIDIGTGTGVLAILAIQLGVKKVLAIENDEWAIENANENFKINHITNSVQLVSADILNYELPCSNGICANLSITIIQKCWNKFSNSLKSNNGDLIISGILIYDKVEIIKNAEKYNFELVETLREDEWLALHFKAK